MNLAKSIYLILLSLIFLSCNKAPNLTIYPQVVTDNVTDIGQYSANFKGYISNLDAIDKVLGTPGFLIKSARKEFIVKTTLSIDGKFDIFIDSLSSGTEYSYKAIVLDSGYILTRGKEQIFSTLNSNVIFMDPEGNNSSGKSWNEAFSDFGLALKAAKVLESEEYDTLEFWIKKGIYDTEQVNDYEPRIINIKLLGGFEGTERIREDQIPDQDPGSTIFVERHEFSISTSEQNNFHSYIENITFKKSSLTFNNMDVSFNNCTFTDYPWAGLNFENNVVSFDNCQFIGNDVEERPWVNFLINIVNAQFRIVNSEFSNNRFYNSLLRTYVSYGIIENTIFRDNIDKVEQEIGATVSINFTDEGQEVLIDGCQFVNNSKEIVISSPNGLAGGGALYFYSASVRIENSEFTKNISSRAPAIYYTVGGGTGLLSLKNCKISNNISTRCTDTFSTTHGAIEIISQNVSFLDLGNNCFGSNWQNVCNEELYIEGADCAELHCDATSAFTYCG